MGSEATPQAITSLSSANAYRAEQLQLLPQAVNDVRQVLAKPGCTWQDYWAEILGEKLDFEFLQECWNDDSAKADCDIWSLIKQPEN